MVSTSCKRLTAPSFDEREELARVGENSLFLEDIKGLFYDGINSADSIDILNNYVDKWVKNRIKIDKATIQFADDSKDIDNLIEEYRNSLLLTKYDNFHTLNIDTIITQSDINEYYKVHKEMFRLSNPIVKARLISFPKSYRAEKKLLTLLKSDDSDDRIDLADLAEKNDFNYIEYGDWVYFTEALTHIPFNEKEFDLFLKKHSLYSIEDGDTKYIMIIDSYKNSGDYSPIKMVESVIKKMIIRDRRNLMLKAVEDSLYNVVKSEGGVIIKNN